MSAIPLSSEKYISFRVGNLIFKDSLSFLLASLESCASKLKEEDLVHTRRYFREQALTNKTPVIDASVPPTSTYRPVQSETATNNIENDDENVTCRKRNLSSSSSSSRPVPNGAGDVQLVILLMMENWKISLVDSLRMS